MKKLRDAGLYGDGLLAIRTAEMRDRYNDCLRAAGLEPTTLTGFSIDGIGWSPEIAGETGNRHYLSQGEANQLAVILSPDQCDRPIYLPMHSFDRPLMRAYFSAFMAQIGDTTRDTGIWLDIEQGISAYADPLDLLLVDQVVVRTSSVGPLPAAAGEQEELVRRFSRSGDAWFDPALRRAIIESARSHGDLRSRKLNIPEMTYDNTRNFHTRALGGVFVFRDGKKHDAVLVCEKPPLPKKPKGIGKVLVIAVDDPSLPDRMIAEGLVTLDLDWYACHLPLLERIHECLLAGAICKHDPGVDYEKLNSAQRKGFIQRLGDDLPEMFFDLERLMKSLQRPGAGRSIDLSPDLCNVLYHPVPGLSADLKDLVWHLLVKNSSADVVQLYRHDKSLFFDQYATWPEPLKRWAVRMVTRWRAREI